MIKTLSTFMVLLAIVLTSLPVVSSAQTRNRHRPDPRGLDRYTLTGETASLSIFSLPAWNGDPEFFDGWGRKTASELGLAGAEFWNEFGRTARKGILHPDAVIRFPNGFQWDEAYLEGCLKNGKVYFNRIKIVKKPTAPVPPVIKELCVNIPLAITDVPSDWTITTLPDGRKSCHYPVPEPVQLPAPPPIVDTKYVCEPGTLDPTPLYETSNGKLGKAFRVSEVISHLPQAIQAQVNGRIPEKVNALIIYREACPADENNILIKVHYFTKGGGWSWVSFFVGVGVGFVLGYIVRGRPDKPVFNVPTPTKSGNAARPTGVGTGSGSTAGGTIVTRPRRP